MLASMIIVSISSGLIPAVSGRGAFSFVLSGTSAGVNAGGVNVAKTLPDDVLKSVMGWISHDLRRWRRRPMQRIPEATPPPELLSVDQYHSWKW